MLRIRYSRVSLSKKILPVLLISLLAACGGSSDDSVQEVDLDGDGVVDSLDAFPTDPTESIDTDGDGVGDNADAFANDAAETADADSDGVGDNTDAFPDDASESVDTDGDGVGDNADAFANDATETVDVDSDGIGDNADIDDDNDLMPDSFETANGLNPLVNDADQDSDSDGLSNYQEYLVGSSVSEANTTLSLSVSGLSEETEISLLDANGESLQVFNFDHTLPKDATYINSEDSTLVVSAGVDYPVLVSVMGETASYSLITADESSDKVVVSELSSMLAHSLLSDYQGDNYQAKFQSMLTSVTDADARLEAISNTFTNLVSQFMFVDQSLTKDRFELNKMLADKQYIADIRQDSAVLFNAIQAKLSGNNAGSVKGVVLEQGTDSPIGGVNVYIPGVLAFAKTNGFGQFELVELPAQTRLPISFQSSLHAINQKIVTLDAQSETLLSVAMKPVLTRIKFSDVLSGGAVASEDADGKLKIKTGDESVSIKVSKSLFSNVIAANQGRIAADTDVEDLQLSITRIDPTVERNIFPGDFEARETQEVAEVSASNEDTSITLESVVLADFTLADSQGNDLQMPEGETMVARMVLPDNLQDRYRVMFENGTRTIPWWSYDETTGQWVLESEATLLDINGKLYAEATLNHFSWWNVDQPISTHSKVCGKVINKDGEPLAGISVQATGISYTGNGEGTTNAEGLYEIRVKKLSEIELTASYGTASSSLPVSVEDIGVSVCQDQEDLKLAMYIISGTVENEFGAPIVGAQIISSSGASAYSNAAGEYQLVVAGNETYQLSATVFQDNAKLSTLAEVAMLEEDVAQKLVINTEFVEFTGKLIASLSGGTQLPISGAFIASNDGQFVESAEDGSFSITAPASQESINHLLNIVVTMPSGLQQKLDQVVPATVDDINLGDLIFEDASTLLVGKVVDADSEPMTGIDVTSNLSISGKTNSNGEFSLEVPVGSSVSVTAFYKNPLLNVDTSTTSAEIIVSADAEQISVPNLVLEGTKPAVVSGTIREKDTLKLLPSITIVSSFGATTTSNEDGEYQLSVPVNSEVALSYSFDFVDDGNEDRRFGSGTDVVTSGASGTTSIKQLILDLESNPPTINAVEIAPQVATPGDSVTISVYAKDPDGDPLTFKVGNVENASITQELLSDGQVKASATVVAGADFGKQTFAIEVVEDLDDPSPKAKRTIELLVKQNSVPVILDTSVSANVLAPGSFVTFSATAFDADFDSITYDWTSGLSDETLDQTGASTTYSFVVPQDTADGEYSVVLVAKDDKNEANFNSKTVSYFVQSNRAPIVTGIVVSPGSTVTEGTNVVLNAVATDPDGDSLTYQWLDSDGEEISTERRLRFTAPSVTEQTQVSHQFVVTDGEKSASQTVMVVVEPNIVIGQPDEVNLEPTPDADVSLSGFVTDPEGSPIVGALIEIYNEDRSVNIQTSSDITGYYQFTEIPSGTYYVVVTRDGFTISSAIVVIE